MNLGIFKEYAMAHMMDLEAILAEVYTERVAGETDYVLFDGGAHRGFHTTRMLNLPGCEAVYAVEADPFMADELRTRLGDMLTQEFPQVILVQKALQDNPQVTEIPWKSSPSHVGRSSIISSNAERSTIWGDNPEMKYRDTMSVDATTIDSILADERRPVPFLKLDLEGADLLSLKGASSTLSEKRPIVAFENSIHAPKVHGFTVEEIASFFLKLDYVPLNFIGEPIGPEKWFGFFEAWAVPIEQLDWLQETVRAAISKRPISE